MKSKNMEQLIEKYKHEMLSYSRRSSFPSPQEPEESVSQELFEQAAEPVSVQESETIQTAAIQEEIAEASAAEPQEPAVSVVARVPNKPTLEDLISPEIKFEDLREDCRKISTGESQGTDEKKKSCTDLYNFLAQNTATGLLSVETYAADRVFGVGSARVMVFIPLESGNVTIYDGLTDNSGNTPQITLPAPPKDISLHPEKSANGQTYAGYTILVEHPDYVRAVFFNVPIFEGIESIQPVQMIARDSEGEPEPIVVTEKEPENL